MGKWSKAAEETYKAIQAKKVKELKRKERADIEADRILIVNSLNARDRYQKSNLRR